MKIPIKIEPDHLKDTIVQIVVETALPQELLPGWLQSQLKGQFNYVTRSMPRPDVKITAPNQIILPSIESFFLDQTGKIKLTLHANSMVFNMVGEYVGWETYIRVIKNVVKVLFDQKAIRGITRVGVRYISQFPNTNLFEKLKVNFVIGGPILSLESSQIRLETKEDNLKGVITLINQVPDDAAPSQRSIIDVDVIQTFTKAILELNTAVDAINVGHRKQKSLFFSLLTEEFLESLNPTYA